MEWIDLPVVQVFIYALITALATGLGALPFFFIDNISDSFLGKSNAVAAGLMLAASYSLIFEGYNESEWMTLAGMLAGVFLVVIANKWLEGRSTPGLEDVVGGKRKQMLIFLGIMTVHSFAEGVSV
ncbi:MAG TPA: ZIP family metal transporter, partial [Balneola sp.]|nr:ZIP family metal transporter [Balneola sp.]